MVMKQYVKGNITTAAANSVKYFIKMLAQSSETVIFIAKLINYSQVDQLILSYGGLRGAIAFGLAMSIPETIMARKMFITTTIVVIFFTVFLQGITIRPLVNFLNVETKDDRPATMTESVYNKVIFILCCLLRLYCSIPFPVP
ncbi:hypothetical protein ANCCEY_12344 [Ancylostoma ceylanicum]|uniref:Cation/H+ exchanger transmembrane domain-containing protein n=1 Tax=Ancylostoma ceylanicum TaxID=53326 RepID=A0A0D6LF59_9BILA|nr:hypothetical protein ANCCEY_12344 [Ancylostoma ceylanicum]